MHARSRLDRFLNNLTRVFCATLLLGFASVAASASPGSPLEVSAGDLNRGAIGCACDEESRDALLDLRDRIEAAPDVEEARALATQPVRLASAALSHARFMAPWSSSLATAGERLDRYSARVASAASPSAIANEFESMMQLDGGSIGYGGGCDYTTGEIIAIVIGFVLGILPGIILLLLLC